MHMFCVEIIFYFRLFCGKIIFALLYSKYFLQLYSEVLNILWFLNPDNGQKVKYQHFLIVRHVTGTGSGLLGGIPRVVVQISALTLKGPL